MIPIITVDKTINRLKSNSIAKSGLLPNQVYSFIGNNKAQNNITTSLLYIAENNQRPTNVPSTITTRGYTASEIQANGYIRREGKVDLAGVRTAEESNVDLTVDYYTEEESYLKSESNLRSESISRSSLSFNTAYTFVGDTKTPTNIGANLLYTANNNARPTNVPSSISRGYTAAEIQGAGYLRDSNTTGLNGVTIASITNNYYTQSEALAKDDLSNEGVYTFKGTEKTPTRIDSIVLYKDNERPEDVPNTVARGYTAAEIQDRYVIPTPARRALNGVNAKRVTIATSNDFLVSQFEDTKVYTFQPVSNSAEDRSIKDITPSVLYKATSTGQRPSNVPSTVSRGYTAAEIIDAGYVRKENTSTGIQGINLPIAPIQDLSNFNLRSTSTLKTDARILRLYFPRSDIEIGALYRTVLVPRTPNQYTIIKVDTVWTLPKTIDEKIKYFESNYMFKAPYGRTDNYTKPTNADDTYVSYNRDASNCSSTSKCSDRNISIRDVLNTYLPDVARLSETEVDTILNNPTKYKFRLWVGMYSKPTQSVLITTWSGDTVNAVSFSNPSNQETSDTWESSLTFNRTTKQIRLSGVHTQSSGDRTWAVIKGLHVYEV